MLLLSLPAPERIHSERLKRSYGTKTPLASAGGPVLDRGGGAGLFQPGDDRIGHLGSAYRGGIVALRLHVVGDVTPLPDGLRDGPPAHVCGVGLAQVAQYHRPGQHHRHRVDLVGARVFRGTAVRRLEERDLIPQVGAGGQAEPAHQAGRQVGQDVAVEVGHDDHVVFLRVLHQLHRHVVDDAVIELDVRVLFGDLLRHLQEEAVGELHDVGLVHSGHLSPSMAAGVIEGKVDDARARCHRNGFDAEPRVEPDRLAGGGADLLDHLLGFRFALLELDPGIDVLGVLAHDDQVDVVVAGANTWVALAGADERVEVELLAQRDVHRSDPLPDRSRQRPFDCDFVAPDRLQHVLGHRRAVLVHYGQACVLHVPIELDAGRFQDTAGGFADFRTDPIAWDQGHTVRRQNTTIVAAAH